MVRPGLWSVDTTKFYFDIYVGGKVRWRARVRACIASSWLDRSCRAGRVDSGIKEQHGDNNVTLIVHVINEWRPGSLSLMEANSRDESIKPN
ncbi:hypothetical protein SETIT_6G160400v2 [Setaria italica]|uniref:Uncharacterized protein n=1 Tax=Setaria italica TaxID=4555 RepID=A0A368RM13_SETIT|nr:hypothetical protein SETIT_6G160400v2 [Setaria italica]